MARSEDMTARVLFAWLHRMPIEADGDRRLRTTSGFRIGSDGVGLDSRGQLSLENTGQGFISAEHARAVRG